MQEQAPATASSGGGAVGGGAVRSTHCWLAGGAGASPLLPRCVVVLQRAPCRRAESCLAVLPKPWCMMASRPLHALLSLMSTVACFDCASGSSRSAEASCGNVGVAGVQPGGVLVGFGWMQWAASN